MRQWFTEQISKEEFDYKVREFLSDSAVRAHNQFLLALLNKCSNLVPIKDSPIDSSLIAKTHQIKSDDKSNSFFCF
jgi:hypothetical protein